MFKDNLKSILKEISSFQPINLTFDRGVDKKLDRSFRKYDNNVSANVQYLLSRDNLKVLKYIDQKQKETEKELEKENKTND